MLNLRMVGSSSCVVTFREFPAHFGGPGIFFIF